MAQEFNLRQQCPESPNFAIQDAPASSFCGKLHVEQRHSDDGRQMVGRCVVNEPLAIAV